MAVTVSGSTTGRKINRSNEGLGDSEEFGEVIQMKNLGLKNDAPRRIIEHDIGLPCCRY